MKLKKELKLYYSEKIRSMGEMPYPQSVIDRQNSSVKSKGGHRDLVINAVAHFVIILVVLSCMYKSVNSSALSESITMCAEKIALDDIVEKKIFQMNISIKNLNEKKY